MFKTITLLRCLIPGILAFQIQCGGGHSSTPAPPSSPRITVQPQSRTIDAPAAVTFQGAAWGSPAPGYQWNLNGKPIPGATGEACTVPYTDATLNGNVYTLTASNGVGSPATSDGAVLTVNGPPVITTQPRGLTVPAGGSFSLEVTATAHPSHLTYQWYHDGSALSGAAEAAYAKAGATAADSGTYMVLVSNGVGGPTQSLEAKVTVAEGYEVSGRVGTASGPLAGVTVSLGTNPVRAAVTDATGAYAFSGVPEGTWALTPSLPAFSSVFEPAEARITLAGGGASVDFLASVGYTVSGSVHNPAPEGGTIYLALHPEGGGLALGTAHLDLLSGGAFAFRGVPPGTYTLTARCDLFDKGVVNAHDPSGFLPSQVKVVDADVTGLALGLEAPEPDLSSLPGPAFTVDPMDGGVVVSYIPIQVEGLEFPKFYELTWSTDAAPAGTRRFTPDARRTCFITSSELVNGTTCHFALRGLGADSATAATTISATVGAGEGGATASGKVTFDTPPRGPLFVSIMDLETGRTWARRIASPVSPQPFSVTGVSGNLLGYMAFLDQGGAGRVSFGDPSAGAFLLPGEEPSGLEVALPSASCVASLMVRHTLSGTGSDRYELDFTLTDAARHVVAALLTAGPHVVAPASLGTNGGGSTLAFTVAATARPSVGDTYEVQVTCHDGTVEDLHLKVTGIQETAAEA